MKEDVERILKMVEEGKIDSEKAAELIDAINKNDTLPQPIESVSKEKMLTIKVISEGKDTVNIKIPVKFLKSLGNAINNVKIPGVSDQEGIDIKMIMEAIDSGLEGKIVDIQSGNGNIVEVCIG